jgi:hypothetical protein
VVLILVRSLIGHLVLRLCEPREGLRDHVREDLNGFGAGFGVELHARNTPSAAGTRSFDDLVSAGEQHRRHCEAESLGGFQVDDQLELRSLFDLSAPGSMEWLAANTRTSASSRGLSRSDPFGLARSPSGRSA